MPPLLLPEVLGLPPLLPEVMGLLNGDNGLSLLLGLLKPPLLAEGAGLLDDDDGLLPLGL